MQHNIDDYTILPSPWRTKEGKFEQELDYNPAYIRLNVADCDFLYRTFCGKVHDDNSISRYEVAARMGIHAIVPCKIPIQARVDIAVCCGCVMEVTLDELLGLSTYGGFPKLKMREDGTFKYDKKDMATWEAVYHAGVLLCNVHESSETAMRTVKAICAKFPGAKISVRNVSTAEAFAKWLKAGAYRVFVGQGDGIPLAKASSAGVCVGTATLIRRCKVKERIYNFLHPGKVSEYRHSENRIVADCDFRNYSQVCKALAMGAEYVLLRNTCSGLPEPQQKEAAQTPKGGCIEGFAVLNERVGNVIRRALALTGFDTLSGFVGHARTELAAKCADPGKNRYGI